MVPNPSAIPDPAPSTTTLHDDAAAFRAAWALRDYPRAAALASRSAARMPDSHERRCFLDAAARARRFEEVRAELQMGGVQGEGIGEPVLEPCDPSSSEARCNMVCEPDRPTITLDKRELVPNDRNSEASSTKVPDDVPRRKGADGCGCMPWKLAWRKGR